MIVIALPSHIGFKLYAQRHVADPNGARFSLMVCMMAKFDDIGRSMKKAPYDADHHMIPAFCSHTASNLIEEDEVESGEVPGAMLMVGVVGSASTWFEGWPPGNLSQGSALPRAAADRMSRRS